MRILAINGSPRKKGNTSSLVDRVLEGARSQGAFTESIDLSDIRIRPVNEADYRVPADNGHFPDMDDLDPIIEPIESSDVVILASPIFFGSITGQLKVLIDRFQFAWLLKNINGKDIFPTGKKGAFISVQAQNRPDFFDNAVSIVKHFFATVNISYDGGLFCPDLEDENDAKDNNACMEKAFLFGQNLAGK
ncbi:MAG: flavodoxin family protein [Candidatus Omnitrophota bacterium]